MNKAAALAITLLATITPTFGQTVPAVPGTSQVAPPDGRINDRITQMRRQLKITSVQEPAWDAFATVMRDNATSSYQAIRQRTASIATMSSVDNLKNFAQIEQTRAQGAQTLAYSYETLYGTFSDEQKRAADALFRQNKEHAESRRQREPKKAH